MQCMMRRRSHVACQSVRRSYEESGIVCHQDGDFNIFTLLVIGFTGKGKGGKGKGKIYLYHTLGKGKGTGSLPTTWQRWQR